MNGKTPSSFAEQEKPPEVIQFVGILKPVMVSMVKYVNGKLHVNVMVNIHRSIQRTAISDLRGNTLLTDIKL